MTKNSITTRTNKLPAGDVFHLPKAGPQQGSGRSDRRKYDTYIAEAFGHILIGIWPDGQAYRYNGNGRLAEFLRRGKKGQPGLLPDTDIPVQVVKIKDAIHSNKVWKASNTTMKVTTNQVHNANANSGHQSTLDAIDLADTNGFVPGPATDALHLTLDSMVRIYNTGDYAAYIYDVIAVVKKANHSHNVQVLVEEFTRHYLDDAEDIAQALKDNLVIGVFNTGAAGRKDTQQKVQGILSEFNKKK